MALEYSRYNNNVTNYYAPDQFRASDHDPVVVGLDLAAARRVVEEACAAEELTVTEWRSVPVDESALGDSARASAPVIEQAILSRPLGSDVDDAERRAFRARRRIERAARDSEAGIYIVSLSFRTVTYKGLCAADQLAAPIVKPLLGKAAVQHGGLCPFELRREVAVGVHLDDRLFPGNAEHRTARREDEDAAERRDHGDEAGRDHQHPSGRHSDGRGVPQDRCRRHQTHHDG